jgi:UDP-2,3-diacylglucosamine pyrophosphatase LpxH
MLVVISDLHFEEELSDHLPGSGSFPPVTVSRNLPAIMFHSFVAHLANEARRNEARRLDLVLAGDLFDIHRTSLWFTDNPGRLRPYVACNEVDQALEAMILRVLMAIMEEREVNAALEIFRLLAQGRYREQEEKDFPVPASLYYLPGNHDRLANASPGVRRAVRDALGIEGDSAPFPHVLTFEPERALIRHGHEYDRYNFSLELAAGERIPVHLPDDAYSQAPFGDFATVDIASRMPHAFRKYHGDTPIVSDRVLRTVYERLLEFDDLRPQSAMLPFLLNIPEPHVDPVLVWRAIEPVVRQMLDDLNDDPFLTHWLDQMDKKWQLDAIDVVQAALRLKSWRLAGIPLGLARFVSNTTISGWKEQEQPQAFAVAEQLVADGSARFVVAGHTHRPATELLAHGSAGEQYYVNTGTWRNRIPAAADYTGFGRLKAMTYAIIYGPDEDPGAHRRPGKIASLDVWSGVTQRWYE